MVIVINVKDALQEKAVFIDTRTPQEFQEDHLPNAVNIPVFSNEERALVGTIYKQVSQDKAVEKGLELFSRRLPGFMQEINQYKDKSMIIYCWRGGMRSRTVTALLQALGYSVKQLDGGYKQYRKYVRERLQNYPLKSTLIILWGLTCSGKTKLLEQFSNSLNLEDLAQHRGSLYGSIGLTPHSQKRFESLLLQRLEELQDEQFIFVEGESKRIGNVIIPESFYQEMRRGKHLLIKKNLVDRAELAVKEYFNSPEDVKRIREITLSLNKVISKEKKQRVIDLLDAGKHQDAARMLLQYYYDPLYNHTLKGIVYALEIENDETKKAAEMLKKQLFNFVSLPQSILKTD